MRAVLYAVRSIGSPAWQWHTSICWDADVAYWRSRVGGEVEIWLARSSLSFGQAEWLRWVLQARSRQFPRESPSEAISSVTTSSVSPEQFPLPIPAPTGQYLTQPVVVSHVQSNSTHKNSDYYALIQALAGRHLLLDEVQALAESHSLAAGEWSGGVLAYRLQLAKLYGDIGIEPGLRIEALRRWPWQRRTRRYSWTCERCGSGGDRLRWTECPHCGQACPYCEECLTMGRVRGCSPLVFSRDGGGRLWSDFGAAGKDLELERLLAPWNLSAAQAAASRAGLEYLLHAEGRLREKRGWVPRLRRWFGWAPLSKAAHDAGGTGHSNANPFDAAEAGYSNSSRIDAEGTSPPDAFLIWAVTGAGKTEMIFPLLAAALAHGGTALVASPRKDVVLELSPRVRRAFPDARVVTLYGGSEQRWDGGDIVIATTHQLMRFRKWFDVVVIDELDAFPFHNSPTLAFAARKVCKAGGSYVLLSATPPRALRRSAERGRLPHVKVPARYHRHPLPVPRLYESRSLQEMLSTRQLTRSLLHCVRQSLCRGAQLFVFVPAIAQVGPLVSLLQRTSPGLVVRGTSSQDPERAEKVQAFRDGHIRLLVTTTILERGVTVPKSDVIVVDADSRLFDEPSLVQMAGRAGRSKLDPSGTVSFIAKDRTRTQVAAMRHIRRMNRLARKMGYLG